MRWRQLVGRPFQTKEISYDLQLYRARVMIESVAKGELPLGPATVDFVSISPPLQGPKRLGLVGDRTFWMVLLLQRAGSTLRTFEDLNRDCVQGIVTGDHPGWKPKANEPLLHSLVDLLFTRGPGTTNHAEEHSQSATAAATPRYLSSIRDSWLGLAYIRMQYITRTPNARGRAEAPNDFHPRNDNEAQ